MGEGQKTDLKNACLGIEFGSTNIKAVLIGENNSVLASGSFRWASSFENGYFTYSMEDVKAGLQAAYREMKEQVKAQYGTTLQRIGCIGISAMMHGYLAFDADDRLLVPFRTWQNTTTTRAAAALSELFSFNIPERWSVSHLYQAVLDDEPHVGAIARINTLAGYVHYLLTGRFVIGVGDASGMFPVESDEPCYDRRMMELFREKIREKDLPWDPQKVLPDILVAGDPAGKLTEAGAALLDPEGDLEAGILFCPPEGDAGTGMTATNSIRENTGNVSAGTSIFSMIVLDKPLKDYYKEIDVVATPVGKPVAMVHCNNCTNDLNAWASLLGEFVSFSEKLAGQESKASDSGTIYPAIYQKALEGDADCGGTVVCNYIAGEQVTGIPKGHPMVSRDPEREFKLANLCRAFLYSSMVSLKIGMDVLKNEDIRIDRLIGHGGLFKNGDVASKILASALRSQVCVMETAEVGGPYGMALLAKYCLQKEEGESLVQFLEKKVFREVGIRTSDPSDEIAAGFDAYTENFRNLLDTIRKGE